MNACCYWKTGFHLRAELRSRKGETGSPEAAAQGMPLSDLVTVIGCRFAPSGTRYIHVRHHGDVRLAMEA